MSEQAIFQKLMAAWYGLEVPLVTAWQDEQMHYQLSRNMGKTGEDQYGLHLRVKSDDAPDALRSRLTQTVFTASEADHVRDALLIAHNTRKLAALKEKKVTPAFTDAAGKSKERKR